MCKSLYSWQCGNNVSNKNKWEEKKVESRINLIASCIIEVKGYDLTKQVVNVWVNLRVQK